MNKYNVEVVFVEAKLDSNTQLSQVKGFISQKVDAIIVNPITRNETNPITDKAKTANVPIISLIIPFANQDYAPCFIAPDSKQASIIEMNTLQKINCYKTN